MLSTWHSSRHACLAHYRRGHIVHPSQNTSYSVLWSRHQSRLVAQSRTTGDYLRQQTRTGFEARAAPTTDTSCSRCWSQLGVNWDEDLLLLISSGRAGTLGTGFQLKILYFGFNTVSGKKCQTTWFVKNNDIVFKFCPTGSSFNLLSQLWKIETL